MAAGDVSVTNTTLRAFKGAFFDGVNDYVNMGNAGNLNGSDNMTISFWFNTPPAVVGAFYFVSKKDQYEFGAGSGYAIVYDNRRFSVHFKGASGAIINRISTTYYDDNRWHHAVVIYNASATTDRLVVYVDNVLKYQSGASAAVGSMTNTKHFRLGYTEIASTPIKGTMRDVRFYNRAITSAEVSSLYSGSSISNHKLFGSWLLADNYNDAAQFSYNGTSSGTYFNIVDDAVMAAVRAQRTASTDKWLSADLTGGQMLVANIQ